ncbi:hypothetical protein C2S52_021442 [Perilla frutescens var. hirtella]|nr:hypothetical protein C2S52_021442 [Perilla frutescens var. hirtella]KAH6808106.1 hypothetical protein C2S51_029214 [Perilla frutescens var. frutescens]
MALSFTRLSWLWLGGKDKEQVSNGSVINSINSLGEWGLGLRGEAENLKFYSMKRDDGRMGSSSSNRKSKRKWKSREERSRMIDKEYDVVLVPSDGVGLSGSESEDSDWSIGWMEPHAPDFQSDDEGDNSFAVLVPCYRHEDVLEENLGAVKDHLPNGYSAGGREYMEQWLSSLQNS